MITTMTNELEWRKQSNEGQCLHDEDDDVLAVYLDGEEEGELAAAGRIPGDLQVLLRRWDRDWVRGGGFQATHKARN
jgi:hypothetical protein